MTPGPLQSRVNPAHKYGLAVIRVSWRKSLEHMAPAKTAVCPSSSRKQPACCNVLQPLHTPHTPPHRTYAPSTTPPPSQDGVTWEGPGPHLHLTSSPDALMASLRAVQPQAPVRQGPGQGPGSAPCRPFDLGQLVGLLGPLAVAEAADGARVSRGWVKPGMWKAPYPSLGVRVA